MRTTLTTLAALAAAALVAGAGCRSEEEEFKPVEENGEVEQAHGIGPHDGDTFDLGHNHNYRFEVVFKEDPRTLTLYLLEHDSDEPVYTDQKELTLNVKVGDKPVSLTLPAAPEEGAKEGMTSRFQVSGEQIPPEIEDEHELAGGRISVTLDGESYSGTIEAHEHGPDDHEGHDDAKGHKD